MKYFADGEQTQHKNRGRNTVNLKGCFYNTFTAQLDTNNTEKEPGSDR